MMRMPINRWYIDISPTKPIDFIFRQIVFLIQISHFKSGFTLPLTTDTSPTTTIERITTQEPIVFSHDSNPFDPSSHSFQSGSNLNVTKPDLNAINAIPMTKHHNVLPLAKTSKRQQRIHVFRPLFVYRQEQAMRRRGTARPSIDPHHFYPYHPYYPYQPYQHHYADYYNSLPHENFDYFSNDLTNAGPDYWYPYH